MESAPTIVNVSELGAPDWRWLGGRFSGDRFCWRSFSGVPKGPERWLRRPNVSRYRACVQAVYTAKAKQAALLVTHEPLMAGWTGALYQMARLEMPHLAFAFTFSNLPTGQRHDLMKRSLRKVDRFVCFSSIERRRYAEYFEIPIEKIDMIRWSVAEPGVDRDVKALEEGPYLCAVGSEGRDYATLVGAMRHLPDLRLALVARPQNLAGLDVPPNVSIHTNIPLQDVWNIVLHARLMVLPLRDTEVPCGHGTLIMSMQLETPTIVTESEGMTDYLENGQTGLECPPGDSEAMAAAIRRLWDDSILSARLTRNARQFASDECSEARTIAYFRQYLQHHGLL